MENRYYFYYIIYVFIITNHGFVRPIVVALLKDLLESSGGG